MIAGDSDKDRFGVMGEAGGKLLYGYFGGFLLMGYDTAMGAASVNLGIGIHFPPEPKPRDQPTLVF